MIEARIGGAGITAPHLAAVSPADRVVMIDRYLADHRSGVVYVEVKRDDPRSWEDHMADPDYREFLHVGVAGDRAAAEYVRGGFKCSDPVIHTTVNDTPLPGEPRVPYGDGRYFPANTVVPLAQVRQLMINFALRGEWSTGVPKQQHDHLVA